MDHLKRQLRTIAKSLRQIGVSIVTSEIQVYRISWWRSSLFECDGESYKISIREGCRPDLLAHELGHYLVHKYELDNNPLYRKHFSVTYRNYNTRVALFWLLGGMSARTSGKPSVYACIDGEEEFCELFRLMSTQGWKAEDSDEEVVEKMKIVENILKQIAK